MRSSWPEPATPYSARCWSRGRDRRPERAELNVIRSYCRERRVPTLSGCTLYTTAEPCPMCAGLCAFVGPSGVVFGVSIAELSALGVPQVALPCAEVLGLAPTPVRVRGAPLHEARLEQCRALASPNG